MLRCIYGEFSLMSWVMMDAVLRFCERDGRNAFQTGTPPNSVHTVRGRYGYVQPFRRQNVTFCDCFVSFSLFTRWALQRFALYLPKRRARAQTVSTTSNRIRDQPLTRPVALAHAKPSAVSFSLSPVRNGATGKFYHGRGV